MGRRPEDCHGCDVTDSIFERYLSWKVASVIVLGLCIGISASFVYTDRSVASAKDERMIQIEELKARDAEVLKVLYDIKNMQNTQIEAIARLEARSGIRMNHLVKQLKEVDRRLVLLSLIPKLDNTYRNSGGEPNKKVIPSSLPVLWQGSSQKAFEEYKAVVLLESPKNAK